MDSFLGILEIIGYIFLFIIVYGYVIPLIANLMKGSAKAAVKKVKGEDVDWKKEVLGIQRFEIRQRIEKLGDDGKEPEGIVIEARGPINVTRKTHIGFMNSIIDITDKEIKPILCLSEQFQEESSRAFQHSLAFTIVEPHQAFADWLQVGVAIPKDLIPPRRGDRKLAIICRLVDWENKPPISFGFADQNHPGLIATSDVQINLTFQEIGYEEYVENREKVHVLSIRLAMAVAMADGSLADEEGSAIKTWVKKLISTAPGERHDELKSLYNTAIKEGYTDANSGSLSLSQATTSLNSIATRLDKSEAMELCFKVMAADGIPEKSELDTIRRVAEALELDFDEEKKRRERIFIEIDPNKVKDDSIETFLDIDPGWSNEQKKKHLTQLMAKWSPRVTSLPEGKDRENAQKMVNLIGEARKKLEI